MQFLEEYARLVRNAASEGSIQQAWDPHRYLDSCCTPKLHTSRKFHQPRKFPRIMKEDPVMSSYLQDAICLP